MGRPWNNTINELIGGSEHDFFPYIGNNYPNWLSYVPEKLKPPTSEGFTIMGNLSKLHLGISQQTMFDRQMVKHLFGATKCDANR